MIHLCGIDPEKKVNEITREERMGFVHLIKAFPLTLCGVRDFNEAIITRGGVSVKEVNPSTMESKLVPGLYFAGEILDVDGICGGYNLTWAVTSGRIAIQSSRPANGIHSQSGIFPMTITSFKSLSILHPRFLK